MKTIIMTLVLSASALAQQPQHGGWKFTPAEQQCSRSTLASDTKTLTLNIVACDFSDDKDVELSAVLNFVSDGDEFRNEPDLVDKAGNVVVKRGVELTLTFDGEAPITERWQMASGNARKMYHSNEKLTAKQFFDKISGASKLTVAYTLATGKKGVATFDLTGTGEQIAALCANGCHLNGEGR